MYFLQANFYSMTRRIRYRARGHFEHASILDIVIANMSSFSTCYTYEMTEILCKTDFWAQFYYVSKN